MRTAKYGTDLVFGDVAYWGDTFIEEDPIEDIVLGTTGSEIEAEIISVGETQNPAIVDAVGPEKASIVEVG